MIRRFDRRYIPMLATVAVLLVLFITASVLYPRFCTLRVISFLFFDNAVMGIVAVGMTFVIISGGIDLSVGAVVGFTTIFVASMTQQHGMHPVTAWLLALVAGSVFGAAMGALIQLYKLPAFLVTLGGMFFARGMAFVVSPQSVGIDHPLYSSVVAMSIPLRSGGTMVAEIRVVAMVFIAVMLAGMIVARWTRYGRNVYAIGGSEQSALLMGLPVGVTKILVYTASGFCSALAGITQTLYTGSGNPIHAGGLELDVIASVVIGGTLLSGGVGSVFGTLLGVLIFGTIDSALKFDGRLSSWWLKIAMGILLLLFILLQRVLSRGRTAGKR